MQAIMNKNMETTIYSRAHVRLFRDSGKENGSIASAQDSPNLRPVARDHVTRRKQSI